LARSATSSGVRNDGGALYERLGEELIDSFAEQVVAEVAARKFDAGFVLSGSERSEETEEGA